VIARAVSIALLLAAVACASRKGTAEPQPATPRVVVVTASGAQHVVNVELARTPEARSRGLMYRESLAPDAGMLFVFDESTRQSFWMRNTLIPLDMIFIDDTGRIVGIVERAEPQTLTGRGVNEPSRYVLEVNGGWSAAHGVAPGDTVKLENVMF
jgi:uncharacterized membrane protein (UPF0127 family)